MFNLNRLIIERTYITYRIGSGRKKKFNMYALIVSLALKKRRNKRLLKSDKVNSRRWKLKAAIELKLKEAICLQCLFLQNSGKFFISTYVALL